MKKLTNLLFLTIIFSKLLGAFFLPQSCWALDHQVKIGVILPLSGSMATLGGAIRNGIELARSERPELFGRIKFIYEDDQYDIKQSIAAYRKLRDLDNI